MVNNCAINSDGEHVDTKFKSIQVNESGSKITLLNPYYDDPYSRQYTRKEICDSWHIENQIRENELQKYHKNG